MYAKKNNPLLMLSIITLLFTQFSFAKPASVIDADVDVAIQKFEREVPGGASFLSKVKGYLVFPSVIKGGFIIGAEYGEGALRINGSTKHFYSMTSGSLGYQIGGQVYSVVIAFVSQDALDSFVRSNGWEAGVDGSIAVVEWGKGKDLTSISYEKPIVAFIYGQKGLMASASIKGTKFQKIIPH
jgi:lipid-binding SYLF domain-containing protein